MKALFLAALVAASLFLVFRSRSRSSGRDERAHSLVDAGGRLVDVRTPGEFGRGHIAGAVNIPVDELDGRFAELGPKSTPLVVYCASGNRSARAKRVLEAAGFETVHDLKTQRAW